jgi:hypothetical protein
MWFIYTFFCILCPLWHFHISGCGLVYLFSFTIIYKSLTLMLTKWVVKQWQWRFYEGSNAVEISFFLYVHIFLPEIYIVIRKTRLFLSFLAIIHHVHEVFCNNHRFIYYIRVTPLWLYNNYKLCCCSLAWDDIYKVRTIYG